MTQGAVRPRTLLFVPGNRPDMLEKASRYGAPGYVPDLEDSVPVGEKDGAREVVAGAIASLASAGLVIPRVNSLASGLTEADIQAVVTSGIAGISVGKIRTPDELREVDGLVGRREREVGLQRDSVGLLPWIETAEAVVRALEICRASPRIRWVAFGAEDYAADMGISRAVDSSDDTALSYGEPGLFHARAAVAAAARAAGVHALDTPYTRFRDEPGLLAEASLARSLGYKGKFAIHPSQVATLDKLFAPTDAEIARARAVMEAADAAEAEGRGSVALDGEMIDAPVIARARNVLRDAELM